MESDREELLVSGSRRPQAMKHWLRLRLVLRAITLLKHPEVTVMLDLKQLICEVESVPGEHRICKPSRFSSAVSDYRLLERLFYHIATGGDTDLNEVDILLRNSYSTRTFDNGGDTKNLVNRCSVHGKTLLYEAATQGNVAAVQLLLRHGADASQKSEVDGKGETSLEAACRWGHIQVAELLLSQYEWTKQELKAALRVTRNPQLKSSITEALDKATHFYCCWC